MLQQDYLMRLIMQFLQGIRRSFDKEKVDPAEAAESLEGAIALALDMDAGIMLGLQPESFASILRISGTDPRLAEYIQKSLVLESHYLEKAGAHDMADLRFGQAEALAAAFGVPAPVRGEIPHEDDFLDMLEEDGVSPEALEEELD